MHVVRRFHCVGFRGFDCPSDTWQAKIPGGLYICINTLCEQQQNEYVEIAGVALSVNGKQVKK